VGKFVGKNSRVATIRAWELSTEPLLIRLPIQYALADAEADPRCQATVFAVSVPAYPSGKHLPNWRRRKRRAANRLGLDICPATRGHFE
jgi:hypothetical protein